MILPFASQSPRLSAGAYVSSSAAVIGDAHIGENASVWFGAVIRADAGRITVGEGSNIQDNCTLHCSEGFPVTVGAYVSVGHNAVLHGCTVGDGSLIGMNATILDGAVIGKGCLVGAGALVTEGKVFPDYSVILGAPAKAVKTLDEQAAARMRENALNYSRLAGEYRRQEIAAFSGIPENNV